MVISSGLKSSKKEAKDWLIAGRHFLTAGVAIPIFMNGLVIPFFLSITGITAKGVSFIVLLLFNAYSCWAGVKYGATTINKVYIIKNGKKIANLASIYFVILSIVFLIYMSIELISTNKSVPFIEIIGHIVLFGIYAAGFYFFSIKYIKSD